MVVLAPFVLAVASVPNVVLVTIDTLRADRVGAYGYQAGETATLDRLAREGVLVEDAVVQVPQTRPSHASIMTGRYPYEHGIRDNYSSPLSRTTPTLASVLRDHGWDTAAVIGAYPVARPSGLNRGFTVFDDPFGAGDATTRQARTERRAAEVVDHALAWLGQPRSKPFFLWVHLFDPHAPYEPPSPWRERFTKAPYDGEVAYSDAQLGRLVGWLDAKGLRGRTLVIVTSDHGEGLGEHGEDEHMFFVYDSTLRIPLLFSWPGRLPAGARVRGQFRSVDLFATVLELVGVTAPPSSGVSRAAFLRPDGLIPDNESYAETLYPQIHFGYAPLRSLRMGGWKYIEAPRAELYRIADDPREMRNLAQERASVAGEIRGRLAMCDRQAGVAPVQPALDPEAAARLAALGYVGGGSAGGATASGVDPKDKIREVQAYQRDMREAMRLYDARDVDGALRLFRRLAGFVDIPSFNVEYYFGRCLLEKRRFAEAIPHLKKAADMTPTRRTASGLAAAPVYAWLTQAYAGAGQDENALATLERGLTVAPANPELLRVKGSILLQRGDLAGARLALEKARGIDATDARLHVELANLHRNLGDLAPRPRRGEGGAAPRSEVGRGARRPRARAGCAAAGGGRGGRASGSAEAGTGRRRRSLLPGSGRAARGAGGGGRAAPVPPRGEGPRLPPGAGHAGPGPRPGRPGLTGVRAPAPAAGRGSVPGREDRGALEGGGVVRRGGPGGVRRPLCRPGGRPREREPCRSGGAAADRGSGTRPG